MRTLECSTSFLIARREISMLLGPSCAISSLKQVVLDQTEATLGHMFEESAVEE